MLDTLTANWPLKVLALAVAFVIWVVVTGEQQVVRDFSVPLDVRLPETRILTKAPLNNVTVRLRGAESRVRRLDTLNMRLSVDLSDAVPGEVDVQITSANLNGVPRGIDVDFIDPDRLRLAVDRRTQRDLPVQPVFRGQPPEGFVFYGARADPESVLVDGPETEVEPLTRIDTNPIRLEMRRQPFVARVGVIPEGQAVRLVDPGQIHVRVDVDVAPVERKLEGIAIELLGPQTGELGGEATATVVLNGPPRLVDRILPSQLRLLADTSGLEPQKRPHKVELVPRFVDLPVEERTRVSIKSVSPLTVPVTISDAAPEGAE